MQILIYRTEMEMLSFWQNALEVAILTTFAAANDENDIKMTIFSFQCPFRA